ncbi:MAG TPA: alpha/beta hydrolase [Desulfobulbus sp.]|nr:alpha/beta hydrolase [Desulfobulbus sp.]
MAGINSKTIPVQGCTVHYLEAGPAGGRDVVLLHGMKFKAATWQELGTLERLAAAGFHGVALDMPGFGESPACGLPDDEVLAGVITGLGLERPVLVGPSMGGRIALEFALDHPDVAGGLVLVGAVGVEENRDRLARIKLPTLIVWGGEDAVSPIANSDILATEIAGARKMVIDGAPHPCYLDKPDIWHTALVDFLSSLR